ncbi:MAG: Kae1-associated serine/threonine protein kinase [archaeon]|jgi:Kae1-associated kinase Bud32|nr:Kae1-associated serine/threonine protein kinase [archaeon]
MTQNIIGTGAEAVLIHKGTHLIKDRIKKSYRLPILDERLRRQRTKKESRLLEKASKLIPVPKIIKTDEKEKIEMEYIDGKKLSEHLDTLNNAEKICRTIGEQIAKLHDADIIHGDLTTSNMILKDDKVYFIDFGLGFESKKAEDKAVDLHLIKQALEAKHFNHFEKFFSQVLEGYKISKHHSLVLARLKAVEKRGRYKQAA